jgi:multicomponent Na+:H+ antiporter subunit B
MTIHRKKQALERRSLILATAVQLLLPLLLLLSLYLLFRGHNDPGGGFVGGLAAAAGFALYALASGVAAARLLLHLHPRMLIAAGLLTALGSGLAGPAAGRPFMTGLWSAVKLPVFGKLGTPLLFDAGVYLVVVGVMTHIIFSLMEEE